VSAVDLDPVVLPRLRRRDLAVAFVFVTVLALYLLAPPRVPDLAAQVARTELVHRVGMTVWWSGWFGGLHLPTYSAFTPMLMSVLTPPLTGVLAALVAAAAMHRLLRSSVRPMAGLIAFLVTDTANLLDGRITFGVGLATGLWCLVGLQHAPSRWRTAGTGALAVLTCLASPLAGLFLGLATCTRLLADRTPSRHPLTVPLLVAASLTGTALLFPGSGSMPFELINLLPALVCAAGVAVFCREPRIRVGAALYLVVLVGFVVYPGPVGVNATRLAWIFTVPLLVAWAPVSRRTVAVIALGAALLPAVDLGGQLVAASDPSSRSTFYRPLLTALAADQAARPQTLGQRVEVVDTRNHWAAAQIAMHHALARGWERQADRANNPIFYTTGALDQASYRSWLTELAVGWVAVPKAELDYASVREAELVSTGLPYLKAIWSNDDWNLYQVIGAPGLAAPGSVLEMDDRGLTIEAGATTVSLAVRWSRYLVLTGASGESVPGCVGQRDGWTFIRVPAPGTYRVVADFDGQLRGQQDGCAG
jgi:hypothetical protein